MRDELLSLLHAGPASGASTDTLSLGVVRASRVRAAVHYIVPLRTSRISLWRNVCWGDASRRRYATCSTNSMAQICSAESSACSAYRHPC